MGFSDNLTEMATDLAQSVAATSKRLAEAGVATSKRVAEIAKLSASNLAEEGGIKKAYVELGKLYYASTERLPTRAMPPPVRRSPPPRPPSRPTMSGSLS